MSEPHIPRRTMLAGATAGAVALLAGCLGTGSESEPAVQGDAGSDGSDGRDGSPNGAGEETGGRSSAAVQTIDNLGTLTVTFLGDGTDPDVAEIPADGDVTLSVHNDGDRNHVLEAPEKEQTIEVAPGDTVKRPWAVPAEPGTYYLRCREHDARLTRVEVQPMGVSGGCPSG
jgi:hypothetical protein